VRYLHPDLYIFTLILHYMISQIITLSWFSWSCPALSRPWSRAAWSKESNRALVSYVIFDRVWVSGILSSTTECFPICELCFTNHDQNLFHTSHNHTPTTSLLLFANCRITNTTAQENSRTNSCVREHIHIMKHRGTYRRSVLLTV
jgi:hypothetical protein